MKLTLTSTNLLSPKVHKNYVKQLYAKTIKRSDCLDNPAILLQIPPTIRHTALKAIVCASKYLGFYEEYKDKLKNYGVKWTNKDTTFMDS
jgi:hypothetical protein